MEVLYSKIPSDRIGSKVIRCEDLKNKKEIVYNFKNRVKRT